MADIMEIYSLRKTSDATTRMARFVGFVLLQLKVKSFGAEYVKRTNLCI
jgi:hypothetical protein